MHKLAMAVGALGLLNVVSPAMGADRFDLNCELHESSTLTNGGTTFSRRLSIDLSLGRWCSWQDGCQKIQEIAKVTNDEIWLQQVDNDFMTLVTVVDRKTFRLTNHFETKQLQKGSGGTTGKCVEAPFTPFPKSRLTSGSH